MKSQRTLIALGVVVVLLGGAATQIAAHEEQNVEGYDLTFGGADEPLITGERMWLELEIVDNETGEPVTNQSGTLNLTIQKVGNGNFSVDIGEKHGEPGVYETPIIFTEPGTYIIHVKGSIEGTEFHTHFKKEVEDHTKLVYPGGESQRNATQSTQNTTRTTQSG